MGSFLSKKIKKSADFWKLQSFENTDLSCDCCPICKKNRNVKFKNLRLSNEFEYSAYLSLIKNSNNYHGCRIIEFTKNSYIVIGGYGSSNIKLINSNFEFINFSKKKLKFLKLDFQLMNQLFCVHNDGTIIIWNGWTSSDIDFKKNYLTSPPFYWSRKKHSLFPSKFKNIIFNILLVELKQRHLKIKLPIEIWFRICEYLSWYHFI